MKNKDTNKTAIQVFNENFKAAMEEKDFDKVGEAFQAYSESLVNELSDAAREYKQTADKSVLAARGIRTLTSAEQTFYDGFIGAASSDNPKQALTGVDKTIPQTIIDTVIADIENAHPLLAALDIVNTYGSTKWLMAVDKKQLAQWGQITSAITQELSGKITAIEFGSNKCTAFIPVPKDLLKLGAAYVDAYVRKILADALALGIEYGAIKGTGKNMPIGGNRDLNGGVVDGVYPEKEAVEVTALTPAGYMTLIALLAEKPKLEGETKGRPRVVSKVALICNPVDFLTKIIPATTVLAVDGSYKNNIFPFPTEVFPTEVCDEGEAYLAVMDGNKIKYMMFLSTGLSGNIEYSDEYQFLEDNRVYAIKLLGTGRPVDNNCFVKLDISNLKPLEVKVAVTSVENPIATIEADATLLGAKLNKSTVAADDTATVSVIKTDFNLLPGTDPTLSYQWQVRAKTGTTWADLTGSYTGYNTANLTVKAADAEKHYRCKVTASGTATGTVYTPECTVEAPQEG